MRALVWLIGVPLCAWLVDWAFDSLGNTLIGTAMVGLLITNIVTVIYVAFLDYEDLQERRRAREDE